MFQTLPSPKHYTQIESDLVRNGKNSSLTFEELELQRDDFLYTEGYVMYTGYKMTQVDANALNQYTSELNRTRCIKTREYLKDARHQMFFIIANEMSSEDLKGIKAKS